MEDEKILELFWQRDQQALLETQQKYGAYLTKVALNVLGDPEDSRESVNDAYLAAWDAIPPHRPQNLCAFLSTLTRRIAIDLLRRQQSRKRGGGELVAALDELADCVSGGDLESEMERRELVTALNDFLRSLNKQERELFLRRYWLAESVSVIAKGAGMSANAVSLRLMRLRSRLREHLEKEGISV